MECYRRRHCRVFKKRLIKRIQYKKGELDLLSGGYPCQSFSYAGKRLGIDDIRGTMFYYYAEFLRQLQPKMFLAENVKGLTTHDGGKTLQTMIDVFEELEYEVKFQYPKPHNYKPVLKDVLKNVPKSEGAKYPEKKKKVFDLVPPGGYWKDLPDDVARDYMKSCYFMGGGRTGIARRLSWEEPSLTLTCSPMMKQTDRCHPDESRPFTTREYARIQSFPDSWEFAGKMNDILNK